MSQRHLTVRKGDTESSKEIEPANSTVTHS